MKGRAGTHDAQRWKIRARIKGYATQPLKFTLETWKELSDVGHNWRTSPNHVKLEDVTALYYWTASNMAAVIVANYSQIGC